MGKEGITMIYQYRFKNAWSFAEKTEVSFVLNHHVPETDSVFTTPRAVRLSKVMAVQGANGAGKTNVLRSLSFLGWFVARSFMGDRQASIKIRNHFFSDNTDSKLEMEFEHNGTHYRYLLVVNEKQVVHESLHEKTNRAFNYLFHRDLTASGDYTIRQKGFHFIPTQAKRVRPNVSLISMAAQYNVPKAVQLAGYFEKINTNVGPFKYVEKDIFNTADFFHRHPKLCRKMSKFMSQVDLGLSDVVIEMMPVSLEKIDELKALPFGIHLKGRKRIVLPLWEESEGTQTMFSILQKILPALEHGGMVVLDELDAGLHPDMVMALLELFTNTESNPNNAQIIFTSYVPDVMDTLLKEQILLVEKDPDGGYSQAWRLDDMKGIRRDENYYGKYRAGAYGATPNI